MKKILLFAPFFVPRKRVGALRPYKFVTHLPSLGWKPSVICFDTKNEQLSEVEKVNIAQTEVFEIKLPFDRTQKKSSSDISASSTPNKKKKKPFFNVDFAGFLDSLIAIDTWLPLLNRNMPFFEKVIEETKPDVLWTTADPWSGLVISKKLKEKYNLPWIVDMRDPWTLCTNRYKKKKPHLKKKEQLIEREILDTADAVVFTSWETYSIYADFYQELSQKFHVIHNGYMIQDADEQLLESFTSPFPSDSSIFKLLFYGKFRDSSPAYVLIPALRALKETYPDTFHRVRIFHVGGLDYQDQELIDKAGLSSSFVMLNATPYEYSQFVLKEADLLVSVLNPNRNQVIPTKFWDYLAAGKPIVSFGKNSELKNILVSTQSGDQFSMEDAIQAADFIHKNLTGSVHSTSANKELVDVYSSFSITKKLVEIASNLTSKK